MRYTKQEAFEILLEKLGKSGFKNIMSNLVYQRSSEEVSVSVLESKHRISVIQRCHPIREGWSIKTFPCTVSGIKRAIRRARSEAGLPIQRRKFD